MTHCRIHPYEPSVGVCASCLRERLSALAAAQNAAGDPDPRHRFSAPDHHPHLLFPQSVSPYVSTRRSVDSDSLHRLPSPSSSAKHPRRRRRDRFPFLGFLFGGHRTDHPPPKDDPPKSWLKSLFRGRQGARGKPSHAPAPSDRQPRVSDRGMSPVVDECEDSDTGTESGYSTDSSSGWHRRAPTPLRRRGTPHRRSHHQGHGVTSFTMCLSPLVRASPGRQRRSHETDVPFSGELRHQPHRHASVATAAPLAPNRSRKLADPGRFR